MSFNRKSIMFCSWKCMGGIVGWYTTTVYALWHPYMQLHELLLLDLSPSIFAWSHTSAHTRNADTQFAYTEHVSNSIKWFYIQWMDETKKKAKQKIVGRVDSPFSDMYATCYRRQISRQMCVSSILGHHSQNSQRPVWSSVVLGVFSITSVCCLDCSLYFLSVSFCQPKKKSNEWKNLCEKNRSIKTLKNISADPRLCRLCVWQTANYKNTYL